MLIISVSKAKGICILFLKSQEQANAVAARIAEEERKETAMVIAAMRPYSIAAAEAHSVMGLATTGQLLPPAALMNDTADKRINEKIIDQKHELHWWSLVTVLLIIIHYMTTTYMAVLQVSST